MHGVINLIAQYLGRADNDRCLGVFLGIAGNDPYIFRIEMQAKFDPLGIGECFQRRGIPGTSAFFITVKIASRAIQVFPEPVGAITRQSVFLIASSART